MRLRKDVFQWHRSQAALIPRIDLPALLSAKTTNKPGPVFRRLPVMPSAGALSNILDPPAVPTVEMPQTSTHDNAA